MELGVRMLGTSVLSRTRTKNIIVTLWLRSFYRAIFDRNNRMRNGVCSLTMVLNYKGGQRKLVLIIH